MLPTFQSHKWFCGLVRSLLLEASLESPLPASYDIPPKGGALPRQRVPGRTQTAIPAAHALLLPPPFSSLVVLAPSHDNGLLGGCLNETIVLHYRPRGCPPSMATGEISVIASVISQTKHSALVLGPPHYPEASWFSPIPFSVYLKNLSLG